MRNFCRIHPAGLVVGGYPCPTSGHFVGTDIPLDNRYVITMFGGGSDAQGVACGGPRADGTWYYIADSQRFGCNTHVRVTNPQTGASCVASAVDVGPNICVEQAAGMPVIDASPLVLRHLFGVDSYGWEDRKVVIAEVVGADTTLGPTAAVSPSTLGGDLAAAIFVGSTAAAGMYLLAKWYTQQRPRARRRSR